VDIGTLPNYLKSFVSCLLLSCSFIFLHCDFIHGIKANRLTLIISLWVNSFVSFLFCNLFYFIFLVLFLLLLFICSDYFLSTVFYSLCPCLFETFRPTLSSPTIVSFLHCLLHGYFGYFQPVVKIFYNLITCVIM
jgi:hypothetical protein